MSQSLRIISALFGLLYLPLAIYGSWLLYKHVEATDLMWFIWWVSIPFLILTQVFSELAKAWSKEA